MSGPWPWPRGSPALMWRTSAMALTYLPSSTAAHVMLSSTPLVPASGPTLQWAGDCKGAHATMLCSLHARTVCVHAAGGAGCAAVNTAVAGGADGSRVGTPGLAQGWVPTALTSKAAVGSCKRQHAMQCNACLQAPATVAHHRSCVLHAAAWQTKSFSLSLLHGAPVFRVC